MPAHAVRDGDEHRPAFSGDIRVILVSLAHLADMGTKGKDHGLLHLLIWQ